MEFLEKEFHRLGARVKVTVAPSSAEYSRSWNGKQRLRRPAMTAPIRIDIQHDSRGEYFDVLRRHDTEVAVLDTQPSDRHLLLLSREMSGSNHPESWFLCGHDERSWFVAAIPETYNAPNVQAAKDALKPQLVWQAIQDFSVPLQDRDQRRTAAFVRQGEWFFIPRYELVVDKQRVRYDEPIRRGGGKAHICQFLYRKGGETVYVSDDYPNGLTSQEHRQLPEADRRAPGWTIMARDARAYVRGSVRHPDHDTIWLFPWHEVVMNTETESRAMETSRFSTDLRQPARHRRPALLPV